MEKPTFKFQQSSCTSSRSGRPSWAAIHSPVHEKQTSVQLIARATAAKPVIDLQWNSLRYSIQNQGGNKPIVFEASNSVVESILCWMECKMV